MDDTVSPRQCPASTSTSPVTMPLRQPGCHDFHTASQICRRDFIQAGLLGGLGLTLSSALQRQALGGVSGRAKSVILVWLQGGVSHHDTLDPKPFAPSDIRGEFQSISTRLPGVRVGEQLPLIAANLDKFAVIRSVTHAGAAHERGSMYMVEGRRPGPGASGSQASGNPQLGTIVAHEQGARNGLPAFVSVRERLHIPFHGTWIPASRMCRIPGLSVRIAAAQ